MTKTLKFSFKCILTKNLQIMHNLQNNVHKFSLHLTQTNVKRHKNHRPNIYKYIDQMPY